MRSDRFNYVVSPGLSGNVTCHKLLSIVSSGFDFFGLVSPFVLIEKKFVQNLEAIAKVLKDTLNGNIKVRLKKFVNMSNQTKGKMTSLILTFSGGGMEVVNGSSDISMELKEI